MSTQASPFRELKLEDVRKLMDEDDYDIVDVREDWEWNKGHVPGARHVVLRVNAPAGTTGLVMRARGALVLTSSIDGRVVDTTRYRYHARDWVMEYWAVPDTGAIVALSIPPDGHMEFDLAARRPGIPPIPSVKLPARPSYIVPSQTGDVSIVYRQWRF